LLPQCLSAASPLESIASPDPGWPQWRGPRRDGRSLETNLASSWPEAGPPRLWTATNLGRGYSAPIISDGRIYLAGDVGRELHLFALDLEGRLLWRATNGVSWKNPYPGARASCALSNQRLFHMNAHGRVACLDPATGRELWSVNVIERFGGEVPTWALGECLLVDGPRLIVTPGGRDALMAALDVRTGEVVWATEPLRLNQTAHPSLQTLQGKPGETDTAGYGSPILVRWNERRLLIGCSLRHTFGVDADTGRLLWARPLQTRYNVVAATPVPCGDSFFVTAPDSSGGRLYGLRAEGENIIPVPRWTTPLDTCHGGQVLVDGRLYGSYYRAKKGWACLDAASGNTLHEFRNLAMGSVLAADGRLYCLSQEGELVLFEPAPNDLVIRGRMRIAPDSENDAWTHPVILDGRLYLRYHEQLHCYDVRAPHEAVPD